MLQDLGHAKFDNLKQFLRGIKVVIKIGNRVSSTKARAIRSLVHDVGAESFEQDGVPTTVAVRSSCFASLLVLMGSRTILCGPIMFQFQGEP